jgi:2-hydroxychromene-2-carboxylate isomerase
MGEQSMGKTVEFYFDFGSAASYLAFTQIPKIAARHGAAIQWRPVLLGGIFKATGNRSPVEVAPKGRYMMEDFGRYAKKYGVIFKLNPHFPINTLPLMRAATAIQMHDPARFQDFCAPIFDAIWVGDKNMSDAAVAAQVMAAAGFNPEQIGTWVSDPAVKQKLTDETNAAVERGLFGAPTLFVDGQMYFGQDRLHFVEEALAA